MMAGRPCTCMHRVQGTYSIRYVYHVAYILLSVFIKSDLKHAQLIAKKSCRCEKIMSALFFKTNAMQTEMLCPDSKKASSRLYNNILHVHIKILQATYNTWYIQQTHRCAPNSASTQSWPPPPSPLLCFHPKLPPTSVSMQAKSPEVRIQHRSWHNKSPPCCCTDQLQNMQQQISTPKQMWHLLPSNPNSKQKITTINWIGLRTQSL